MHLSRLCQCPRGCLCLGGGGGGGGGGQQSCISACSPQAAMCSSKVSTGSDMYRPGCSDVSDAHQLGLTSEGVAGEGKLRRVAERDT